MLSCTTSISYHWMSAKRAQQHLDDARREFSREWLGKIDTYTREVNRRWGNIGARLRYMHQRRADRLHSQLVKARFDATNAGLDWRKVRTINGVPKYDPNAEPVTQLFYR